MTLQPTYLAGVSGSVVVVLSRQFGQGRMFLNGVKGIKAGAEGIMGTIGTD